jgi:hypothetical protein
VPARSLAHHQLSRLTFSARDSVFGRRAPNARQPPLRREPVTCEVAVDRPEQASSWPAAFSRGWRGVGPPTAAAQRTENSMKPGAISRAGDGNRTRMTSLEVRPTRLLANCTEPSWPVRSCSRSRSSANCAERSRSRGSRGAGNFAFRAGDARCVRRLVAARVSSSAAVRILMIGSPVRPPRWEVVAVGVGGDRVFVAAVLARSPTVLVGH